MNIEELAKKVKFSGDLESFEAGFNEEREEHAELDDVTVAHIAADHLKKDPEYYEDSEEDESEEDLDQEKEDSEDMVNIYNSLKSKGKEE